MSELYTLAQIDEVVESIRSRAFFRPRVGIILGSGLGTLAAAVENAVVIPYRTLPHWPLSTAIGHEGNLVVGQLEDQAVAIMQGRIHYYEGYSMAQVTLPVRVLQRSGLDILIVTNAAGAINPEYMPGDLMLIKDHLSLIAMTGPNPLRGPNLDDLGPRFPDMSQAYDRKLRDLARTVATDEHLLLREGIYAGLAGPSFETPADLRYLHLVGADAVGMSTVPEVIVARHAGTRVLGISGISNKANMDGDTITTHEEVLEAGKKLVPKLTSLIKGVLRRL